ncbi:putative ferric reductase transmembrane component [Hypsizygus marmoreus]|uniref:ferric-chelate reductase (NADPH) n=1 Tax=Hypsizygus marmoreus TaxID=39966 RepID=A0A369KBF0_HYPMA|nr:putative ferric reductase transmembrane component [Hypsizygus marmoreus]
MVSLSLDDTILAKAPDPDKIIRIAQAKNYPNNAWYCIASFIGFVSACHIFSLLYHRLQIPSNRVPCTRGKISLRRLPAATLNAFRSFSFRWTIPIGQSYTLNVAEVFLTAAYIVIIFVWSLVNSTNTKGLKYDPKYWANTAGNIAASQLPLMTALGMKNNIISWLTGVGFEKLNYLHRMSARVLCVLIWLHGAGRMKLGMNGTVGWDHPWVQCGLLAATSLTILSITSMRSLRDRNYEIFLVIHFVLAFICVLGAYFHAQGLGLGHYIWPSFLIWGLDRFLRAARMVAFNYGYFGGDTTEHSAHIEVLSPHFLRITLRRPRHLHWRAGQCAYLTVPSVSANPFEAHPFTISTIDTAHLPNGTPVDEKLEVSTPASRKLAFLVRVRSGFTRRLFDAAGKDGEMKVIFDGPYSSPPRLERFETIILIAGGSGVAFTLPLLLDSIDRARRESAVCRKIVFVWAIRELSHVEWISDALLPALQQALPPTIVVQLRIFVTAVVAGIPSWDDDSAEGDTEMKTEGGQKIDINVLDHPCIRLEQGRPDLQHIIDEEINQSSGPISVNVCGTDALVNAARSALQPLRFVDVLKGGPTVTLHVEAYGNM